MKAALRRHRQKLLELSYAYWKPRVLQAAVKAGIFTLVENWKSLEPLTPRALAVRLGWEPRATEIFLNALAGCGFLEKKGPQFRNSLQAREFLLPGKKYYVGHILNLSEAGWQDWGNLEESLRSGKSLRKPDFFAQNAGQVRGFILAMQNTAIGHAEHLARKISLKNRRKFLDLGTGPGTFSIAFLKRNRRLHVTLYDLPLVLETTRECVEAEGLSRRVDYQWGNFLKDPVHGRFDTAFVSHILHGLPESQCLELLEKIKGLLEPGGLLILQDFFLDENEAGPEFAALFSLNMLLHTEGGRSYSAREAVKWLTQAGYVSVRRPRLGLPRDISILTAEKK